MATFEQISEESRPPDSPSRKLSNRISCANTSISPWRTNPKRHPYHNPDSMQNKSVEFNNNAFFEVEDPNKNVQVTVKKNLPVPNMSNKTEKTSLKQSLPKLLCLRKSPTSFCNKADRNTLKTLNVNELRIDNSSLHNNYFDSASTNMKDSNSNPNECDPSDSSSSQHRHRQKNRNSFHQNVEEALSSLLWQPYEYQNNNDKSPSLSYSSCSCSPSSSCNDLDEITKNDGTSVHCSFTDLHLPTSTSEMVINLQAENLIDQSNSRTQSRDAFTIRSTSWLSDVFSLTETSRECAVHSETNGSDVNRGDMQVNVSSNAPIVPQTNVLNISTAENGLRTSVPLQNQQNIFQNVNDTNLSSANVVGLPNHTRYASVPVSTIQNRSAGNGNNIFPNHARHISEPSNQFTKYNNNLFSQPGSSISNHYRHSSQVDQSNLQQISHSRSCSVPKSMPVVARHESSTTTTTTTVPSSHIHNTRFSQKVTSQMPSNISNVNVNFYRAVPVNVVSSVPTIHCLNTLSNVNGNEVSNVQVLPLGSNYSSPTTSNFPVTTSNNSPSFNIGTTQVLLHNIPVHNNPANSNSIQIPSQNFIDKTFIRPSSSDTIL
ncbi:hypothetical protein JTB14_020738 [Gonioctena quinquepunctata]|nr:hypothetical protein JTB14_020738 [Gonioctena quinquepunctata]